MVLESERLLIKDVEISEASFYFELFNDPDWVQYCNDKGLKSVEETEIYLKDMLIKNSKLNGLGFFSVILKETNEFIGLSSAIQREKLDFVDVGYGLLPRGRGKGYASEATLLMMDYVKEKFQQEKVLAFTMPGNDKSQHLLQRLGFKYVGLQTIFEGEEDCVYEYKF